MSFGDVVVAVVGVALLAAAGGGLVLARLPDEQTAQTFPGVRAVQVRLGAGRVEISERDRREVRMRATVRRRLGRPRPRTEIGADGVLRVDGRASQARVRLELPRRTPVRAEVRHGEITLWGSDGDLVLVTEHGTVAGRELGGATVRARSATGNVALHFAGVPNAVTALSDSGSVTVVVPGGRYDVEVETANPAGAEVDLPDQPDGERGGVVESGVAGVADGVGHRILARSRVGRVRVASSATGPVRI